MIDSLFLGALIGSGVSLLDESSEQTRILAGIQDQMIEDYLERSTPKSLKRTKHQRELVTKASKALEKRDGCF